MCGNERSLYNSIYLSTYFRITAHLQYLQGSETKQPSIRTRERGRGHVCACIYVPVLRPNTSSLWIYSTDTGTGTELHTPCKHWPCTCTCTKHSQNSNLVWCAVDQSHTKRRFQRISAMHNDQGRWFAKLLRNARFGILLNSPSRKSGEVGRSLVAIMTTTHCACLYVLNIWHLCSR